MLRILWEGAGVTIRAALPNFYSAGPRSGVVADLGAYLTEEWGRLIADCAVYGVHVFHFKEVHEALTGRVDIDHLSQNNLAHCLKRLGRLAAVVVIDSASTDREIAYQFGARVVDFRWDGKYPTKRNWFLLNASPTQS